MALTDLSVFQNYLRTSAIEMLMERIDLFNDASNGAIVLGTEAHPGDYFDSLSFKLLAGVVKTRNPYASNTIASKVLQNITETLVKVGAGSYPVDLSPSQFRWIQQDPAIAGVDVGASIAQQMLQQMLTNALAAAAGAIANVGAALTFSMGGTYAAPKPLSYIGLAEAAGLFGDNMGGIKLWVMNSTPATSLLVNALTNNERLFQFGNVNIMQDAVGRRFLMTDNAALKLQATDNATTPNIYGTLGLTDAAVTIMQQDDFTDNYDERNGNENITRTYQSEWSYMLGVKGYTWSKTSGGHAPNMAALATGSNWTQYVTDIKSTAGVLVTSNS
jgi:hypothetical protein